MQSIDKIENINGTDDNFNNRKIIIKTLNLVRVISQVQRNVTMMLTTHDKHHTIIVVWLNQRTMCFSFHFAWFVSLFLFSPIHAILEFKRFISSVVVCCYNFKLISVLELYNRRMTDIAGLLREREREKAPPFWREENIVKLKLTFAVEIAMAIE